MNKQARIYLVGPKSRPQNSKETRCFDSRAGGTVLCFGLHERARLSVSPG